MKKLRNFRLSESEFKLLTDLGQGNGTRGIRALLQLLKENPGKRKAKKLIKERGLGL